jgi:hypothetical protein
MEPTIQYARTGGDFDEIKVDGASVHIERMSGGHIWMVISTEDQSVTLDFQTKRFSDKVGVRAMNDGFKMRGRPNRQVTEYNEVKPFGALFTALDGGVVFDFTDHPENTAPRGAWRGLGVALLALSALISFGALWAFFNWLWQVAHP